MPDVFIACEAVADLRVAKGFAERVLLNELTWFEDLTLEARPIWGGFLQGTEFLRWASIRSVYKAVEDEKPARVSAVLGRFGNGIPPKLEAINALKALRLAELTTAYAVILMRDTDAHKQAELRAGLLHGFDEYLRTRVNNARSAVQVILATPDRYREAWLLAGFVAKNNLEQSKVNAEKHVLSGIDPFQEPHRLQDAPNNLRCAKDIWNRLSDQNETREEACWSNSSLEVLRTNGEGCGLVAYLDEVKNFLVPALSGRL